MGGGRGVWGRGGDACWAGVTAVFSLGRTPVGGGHERVRVRLASSGVPAALSSIAGNRRRRLALAGI